MLSSKAAHRIACQVDGLDHLTGSERSSGVFPKKRLQKEGM
jgi:hypothetical protein